MTIKKIKELAECYGVRVSTYKKQGKRVIVLNGYVGSLQGLSSKITGYWIEKIDCGFHHLGERCTGRYNLYNIKSSWEQ